uniref:Uncharacterized protein n=1 Tax=Anguilla anguilla TaxID=7936 RepID=A0A0E9R8V8_ANGAN
MNIQNGQKPSVAGPGGRGAWFLCSDPFVQTSRS